MTITIEVGNLTCQFRSWGEKNAVPIIPIDEALPDDPNLTEWWSYTWNEGTLKAGAGARRRVLEYLPMAFATCSSYTQYVQCSLSATQTLSVYEVSHYFYYLRLSKSATWNSFGQVSPSGSSEAWGSPGADLGALIDSKTGVTDPAFNFTAIAQNYLGGYSIPVCYVLSGGADIFCHFNIPTISA